MPLSILPDEPRLLAGAGYILFLLCAFLIFCAAGCATMYNPATGQEEFILISTEEEIQIGRQVAAEIQQKYPIYRDQRLNERINSIGQKIAAVNDRKDLPYYFIILDDDEINAFTVPGGYVYVFRGLVDFVKTDEELAGVLAHEVGHVAARHIVKKMQAQMGYELIFTLATRGKEEYQSIANFANLAFNLVMLGYSREDEYFADILAVRYMNRAGYNPRAMISFLERLKGEEKGQEPPSFLSTHPGIDERITHIKDEIAMSEQAR